MRQRTPRLGEMNVKGNCEERDKSPHNDLCVCVRTCVYMDVYVVGTLFCRFNNDPIGCMIENMYKA
jgi:hypothetical protein